MTSREPGAEELLRQQQLEFAAHLRAPDRNPAPRNIEDRRMQIYRDLFINNVTNFLGNSFPVLSDLLGQEQSRIPALHSRQISQLCPAWNHPG